jgi:uncharacterized protein (DUF433 family)
MERERKMAHDLDEAPTIVRTDGNLMIAGTRITLYSVMDYVVAGYPPKLIRDRLNLTDQQTAEALKYIEEHRTEVEADYQEVLREAEEIRHYWEERNRERLAQIAAMPPKPGQEAIRAKLKAWKAKIEKEDDDSGRPRH